MLLILFFFLSGSALANEGAPTCRARIEAIVQDAGPSASFDYLLRAAILVEREILPECPEARPHLDTLHKRYLAKFGIRDGSARHFRALIAPQEEAAPLAELRPTKETIEKNTRWLGEVALSGVEPAEVEALDKFLAGLGEARTILWNSRALFKVAISPKPGVAAFVPELATLLLSRELLALNRLHRLVLVHELAHAAASLHPEWVTEHGALSAWPKNFRKKAKQLAPARQDELTQLSWASPFSLLPDPVLEGFPFAKTYRNTKSRKDLSEDYADSVAAFFVAPERFCWKKRPNAAKKYAWVRDRLSPTSPALDCSK